MDRSHDGGAHSNHSHDGGVKISGPGLDRCRQRLALPGQRDKIAADAEQFATRGDQDGANIVALAHLRDAEAELPAEVAVDRIAPVGPVENDMSEAIGDLALEARCRCRQTHFFTPVLARLAHHIGHAECHKSSPFKNLKRPRRRKISDARQHRFRAT